jgi:hypothetical protein
VPRGHRPWGTGRHRGRAKAVVPDMRHYGQATRTGLYGPYNLRTRNIDKRWDL